MDNHQMKMGWGHFALTIAASTFIMFFLMYQLVYEPAHLQLSLNRLVAALVMGAVMTAVMLVSMWSMMPGGRARMVVLAGAIAASLGLLAINRSQALIGDVAFMQSMIPHHSIAINNGVKAEITDPRVRALADKIIEAQVREIREMELLIDDIRANGSRGRTPLPARAAVVTPDMLREIREAVR